MYKWLWCDVIDGVKVWSDITRRHGCMVCTGSLVSPLADSEKLEMARAPLGVKAVFKPQRPLRQFPVHVKEKTSLKNQKEVVNEVPCKDCKLKYIGETKRSSKTRMTEHKYAVRRGDEQNSVAVHVLKL